MSRDVISRDILRRGIQRRLEKYEPIRFSFPAMLGDGQGNIAVPGRTGYVYVRIGSDEIPGTAFNQRVPLRNNLAVIVGYTPEQPKLFQVLSIREVYNGVDGYDDLIAQVVAHHTTHEFLNDDVVWVQGQQFLPVLGHPSSPLAMTIEVYEGWYAWADDWHYFEEATSANLAGSVPGVAGQARYVLISIDGATEALQTTVGAVFPQFMPPADMEDKVPTAPAGSIPVAAVYLVNGQTTIDWDSIYDLRLFAQPVGGSVTPAAHDILSAEHGDTVANAVLRGAMMVGDATPDWARVAVGIAHAIWKVNAGGTDPAWVAFDWDDLAAAAGADMVHDHSAAGEGGEVPLASLGSYTQGDLIYGGAADWQDLAHPGAANRVLQSTAAEVGWSAQAVTFPAAGAVPVGTGANTQVTYWTGVNSIAGDAGMTYNAATDTLSIAGDIVLTDDHYIGITGDIRIEFDQTDGDIMLHLGDAAGGDQVQVLDSGPAVVAYIDSDGNADFAGHVAIGAAAAVDTHYTLRVEETFTTFAFNFYNSAAYVIMNAAPGGDTAVTRFHGLYFRLNYQGANDITVSNSLRGCYGGIDLQGTGSVTDACAVQGLIQATGGAGNATVGDIFNFEATFFNEDTINVTNWYGFYMHTLAGGGGTLNCTNAYGLYIEAITQAATNYAIYCAGGDSYHAGNFGVGVTPIQNVEVADGASSSVVQVTSYSTTNGNEAGINLRKSSNAAIGTPQATAADEDLGIIRFYGCNSAGPDAFALAAYIFVEQEGAAGVLHVGGRVRFYTSDNTANPTFKMGIEATGDVGIGSITVPTANGGMVLFFGDNTADPTMGANTAGFYGKDVTGTVEAFCVDEAGNATQLSPHDPKSGEWMFFSRNVRTGREVRVDMERMVREFERVTGKQFLFESVPLAV